MPIPLCFHRGLQPWRQVWVVLPATVPARLQPAGDSVLPQTLSSAAEHWRNALKKGLCSFALHQFPPEWKEVNSFCLLWFWLDQPLKMDSNCGEHLGHPKFSKTISTWAKWWGQVEGVIHFHIVLPCTAQPHRTGWGGLAVTGEVTACLQIDGNHWHGCCP